MPLRRGPCYRHRRIIGIRDRTSTILLSEYNAGSRSSSTIMVLISVENCRGGVLSLARWLGSWVCVSGCVRPSSFDRLTSSKRPSIFNCHAGIPWPVSKFGGSAEPGVDVSPDCHACPETV